MRAQMSEGDLVEQPLTTGKEQPGKPTNRWLAIALTVIVVASVVLLLRGFAGQQPVWMLIVLGGFSVIAFAGIISWLLGFVHFGHEPQQRTFFDSLVDGLEEACVVTDKRGRVIYSNTLYRQLLERVKQERVVGFENLYAGYPEVADKVYVLAQSARSGEKDFSEFRLAKGSSAAGAQAEKATWVRLSVQPIGARQGRSYALWRFRDVTETRMEQEKAFSHLQYIINYLDHAPAGFFSTRENGEIAYINATLADWLGLDLQDTTDGSITLSDIVSGDDAKMLLDIKPGENEQRTAVFDVNLRPGPDHSIPVRIVHRSDFDSSGKQQPSRSLVLDMRKGAEICGKGDVDNMRFVRLMSQAPFGIAEISKDGTIHKTNSAFIGLGDEKTSGAKLHDLVKEKSLDSLDAAISGSLTGGDGIATANVEFKGDDENTANVVIARLGEVDEEDHLVAYVLDTSKRTSLEEQLAQSQKMQAVGQLAGGVAHDFNNVLTAIIGFSDLLLVKHRPTDPSFADIMNIKQNANRAANLVRQLLAFSRRQTLRPQIHALNDVMSDLGNLLGRLLGERIEIEMVYGRDLGLVKVDINQFEQVIINLAVNARDAMEMEGKLIIRTSNVSASQSREVAADIMPEGEYVLCEVQDTGSGMPPEVMAKIYEPFFSTKDIGKGTGLGLSTVYGIVKQTGGFIFCTSEVGKGTTFKVYLPRVYEQEEDEVVEEQKVEDKKTDMTGDATILLVEDEAAVRAFASRALATRGFTVLEADSGEVALEVIAEHEGEIDLVLSDVVMPEMDGPTMLKEMRKRGITTKFIFISGYAEDAFEKNLEGHDDFAFLPKPFSLKQLTAAVKDALKS
jgi:two-component system cell cycle sensor histidine kinase/response regulator CckA